MVLAFVDGETRYRGRDRIDDRGLGGGAFFGEGHPLFKGCDYFGGNCFICGDEVGLGDVGPGLGEGSGEGAVIREDDEAGGGAVEAASEVEIGCPGLVDEIDDGAVLEISGGAYDPGGLVEENVARRAGLQRATFEGDRFEGTNIAGALPLGGAVYTDISGGEMGADGASPELGEVTDEAIQSHEHKKGPPAKGDPVGKIGLLLEDAIPLFDVFFLRVEKSVG